MKTLILCILASIPGLLQAQSYYYLTTWGPEEAYYWGTNGTVQLSSFPSDQNEVLSAPVNIPFPWVFYEDTVTQYLISENGYITFDMTETVSYAGNGTLPLPLGPKQAIYAFWDDLELTSYSGVHDEIVTWTYGTFPNRVHVIQWQSVTPLGGSPQTNYVAMAIRLFEGGDFDIVHNLARSTNTLSGTVGVENLDATYGLSVDPSPNHAFPTVFPVLQEDMVVYEFYFDIQYDIDLSIVELDVLELVADNDIVNIEGSLINYGSQQINSFDLYYKIGSGQAFFESYSGLSLDPNETMTFDHASPWMASNPGIIQTLTVFVTNVNVNADGDLSNDTLSQPIFVNNGVSATKRVFIEEFSTAPCGWCPRGHLLLDSLLGAYPDIVGMTHHSGYQFDSMTIPGSEDIADDFALGAPSGTVDRVYYKGGSTVGMGTNKWTGRALARLNENAPVGIHIINDWDEPTRTADITVTAFFVDFPYPGDLRLSVFIIEDSVSKVGNGYDQSNYYNSDPTHPYFQLGDPIIDYVHRHVIREIIPATWGDSGIIANDVGPGQSYTVNYQYKVPGLYNEENMSIISFVNYGEPNRRDVLNVIEHHGITKTNVFVEENAPVKNGLQLYPNPSSGLTAARITVDKRDVVQYRLYDAYGTLIDVHETGTLLPGSHSYYFDVSELSPGVYILQANTSDQRINKKLIVIH